MTGAKSKVNVDKRKALSNFNGRISKIESELGALSKTDKEHANHMLALYDLVNDIRGELSSLKTRLGLDYGSPDNLVTLHSDILPPELSYLQQSLHIPDARRIMKVNYHLWGKQYSHFHAFADLLGVGPAGIDHVKEFRQLPAVGSVKRYPINIEFSSRIARDMAVESLTKLGKEKGEIFPVHYCVNKFPLLKHNLRAVTSVLKQLQKEGEITWFATNNLMAINGMEKVAPMYVFRTPGMKEPTSYSDCATNEMFHNGVFIPLDDKSFESDEFNMLMHAIRKHVEGKKSLSTQIDGTIPVAPGNTRSQSNTTPQNVEGKTAATKPSYVDMVKTPARKTKQQPSASNSDRLNSQGKRGAKSSPLSNNQGRKKVKMSENVKSSYFGEIVCNSTPLNSEKKNSISPRNIMLSPIQQSTNHATMQQPNLPMSAIMADLRLSQQPKYQNIYTTTFKQGPYLQQKHYSVAYQAIGPSIFNNCPIYTSPPATQIYSMPPQTVSQNSSLQDQQEQNSSIDAFANMLIGFHNSQ